MQTRLAEAGRPGTGPPRLSVEEHPPDASFKPFQTFSLHFGSRHGRPPFGSGLLPS